MTDQPTDHRAEAEECAEEANEVLERNCLHYTQTGILHALLAIHDELIGISHALLAGQAPSPEDLVAAEALTGGGARD